MSRVAAVVPAEPTPGVERAEAVETVGRIGERFSSHLPSHILCRLEKSLAVVVEMT